MLHFQTVDIFFTKKTLCSVFFTNSKLHRFKSSECTHNISKCEGNLLLKKRTKLNKLLRQCILNNSFVSKWPIYLKKSNIPCMESRKGLTQSMRRNKKSLPVIDTYPINDFQMGEVC